MSNIKMAMRKAKTVDWDMAVEAAMTGEVAVKPSGFRAVQDFVDSLSDMPDCKLLSYKCNEAPNRFEQFPELPSRFQEVITIKVLVKKGV